MVNRAVNHMIVVHNMILYAINCPMARVRVLDYADEHSHVPRPLDFQKRDHVMFPILVRNQHFPYPTFDVETFLKNV